MRRRLTTLLCGILAASASMGPTPLALAQQVEPIPALVAFAPSAAGITWQRLGGLTRYQTMSAVSGAARATSLWAVIASGDNYPDALAANALAGAIQAPVLITSSGSLSPECATELERLGVTHAYLIGGKSALKTQVETDLASKGILSVRLSGTDRAQTSLEVARELKGLYERGNVALHSDMVFVTTGSSFAGALCVSPFAYATGMPILLTDTNGRLTDDQVDFIATSGTNHVVLVCADGFTGAIVQEQVSPYATVERIEGEGEGASALSVSAAAWEAARGFSWSDPLVCRASLYPDALCAGTLAGSWKQVLLLMDDLSDPAWKAISDHAPEIATAHVVGGLQATPVVWSTNEELNAIVDTILASYDVNDPQALWNVFQYVSGLEYITGDTYPAGEWQEWSVPKAIDMYRSGGGNCYGYASLMCWLARRLGYDARVVSGNTLSSSQGQVPHGWVEVVEDGRTLIIDPERYHSMGAGYDLFMVTYDEAPIYYYDLLGNNYV